jgi:hypothetical protein
MYFYLVSLTHLVATTDRYMDAGVSDFLSGNDPVLNDLVQRFHTHYPRCGYVIVDTFLNLPHCYLAVRDVTGTLKRSFFAVVAVGTPVPGNGSSHIFDWMFIHESSGPWPTFCPRRIRKHLSELPVNPQTAYARAWRQYCDTRLKARAIPPFKKYARRLSKTRKRTVRFLNSFSRILRSALRPFLVGTRPSAHWSSVFFVLGCCDTEMAAIRSILDALGVRYANALHYGMPLTRRTAYHANGTDRVIPRDVPIVTVECRVTGIVNEYSIDHHAPGDSGWGLGPEDYWRGSSIGQIVDLLVKGNAQIPMSFPFPRIKGGGVTLTDYIFAKVPDVRFIAAADHCLAAAFSGMCPGIDRDEFALWGAFRRARGYKKSVIQVVADDLIAVAALQRLPSIEVGGLWVLDATSEERDSCWHVFHQVNAGVISFSDDKCSVRSLDSDGIRSWMSWAATNPGLHGVYGNPDRGYAGAYFVRSSPAVPRLSALRQFAFMRRMSSSV